MTLERWWHYESGGAAVGPVTLEQMQALVGRGEVTARTRVWTGGMADWAEAATTRLAALFAPDQPPPLRPPPLPTTPVRGATPWSRSRAPSAREPVPAAPPARVGPAPWMGFWAAIRHCLVNYARFSGRASRSEYWWFALFAWLITLGLMAAFFVADHLGGAPEVDRISPLGAGVLALFALFYAGTFIPSYAVISRRFHDAGWSFWWALLGLIPAVGVFFVVLVTLQRDPLPNRFDA